MTTQSTSTLPGLDGFYYQWLKPTEVDVGLPSQAVRYLKVGGDEIDLSELMFESPEQAVKALKDELWGWTIEDAEEFVLVEVQKTPVKTAVSLDLTTTEDHPPITFNGYGETITPIGSDDLIQDENCVARAELSGSEGFFVEVARWDDDFGWHRYAYCKFFDMTDARSWEAIINANADMAKIFHTLPSAPPQAD